MKVAIVHDFLTQDGGAERVLKVLQEIFPQAPTFTIVYDQDRVSNHFRSKDIRTTFIQKLPLGKSRYQWFLPLMPTAIEQLNLTEYDLVISSSSAFAKGIITAPPALHICYCHTPTRYLWSDTHSYVQDLGVNRVIKKILPTVLTRLRLWDRMTADRVDRFIANSKTVKRRIKKYYLRESEVIHPPVATDNFQISDEVDSYFLAGGRLVPYKRIDLVITAFNRLGIPLKIFGFGPEEEKLKAMAKPNIEFLGKISDKRLKKFYSHAQAFIHPQEEDFGIMAVESMASGRPVIALRAGGAKETVVEGLSGKFFEESTWEALGDAVIRFQKERYSPQAVREHALNFDTDRFKQSLQQYVANSWQDRRS